jgi:type IV secretion system protein VirB4
MQNTARNVETKDSGGRIATPLFDLKLKSKTPAYSKFASREVDASEFIPYACHYDENTILTKSGDLLQIIKIDGLPFETADPDWLVFQKNLRNTILRSITKSRYAVYVHTIRRKQNIYPDGEFPQGFASDLNQAWKNKQSRLDLYVNDFYLTLIQKARASGIAGLKDRFRSFTQKLDKGEQERELKLAHKELRSITDRFLTNLKDYGARLLGMVKNEKGLFSEPAQLFGQLINLEDSPVLAPAMGLDCYLPSKRLFFGKDAVEVRGVTSSKLAAVISIKEYADSTVPGLLDRFLEIPTEFILTQSFLFTDRQASLSKIQTQQRKMLQTEDLAVSQIEQIDEALDDTTSGRIGFGYHHLTVLVKAETPKKLDQALANVEAGFLDLGIVAVREDINLEPCFWAQLSGNFPFIARSAMISTANFAGFASLHNYPCGKPSGNHWGPAVTVLETVSGTPYFFNFHVNDVGHTTIIGPTGTGKSVLLNFLIAQCFKYHCKIFFFDKDRGGEIFIRALNGAHSTIGVSQPSGFNPLKLPDTPENRAFLVDWLQLILTSHGETLNSEDLTKISEAIEGNYKLDLKHRTLENLAPFLGLGGAGSLANRLSIWHGKGTHANLFGNEEDILKFDQPFYGFEMGEILEDKKGLPPVLAYLFHRINLTLNGQPTIIVLEEGWKLLDNPYFAPKIKDWLQTIRKRNGFVIFLTPNIESAIHSTIGDTLVQQSATSIFLPNHKATSETYCGAFKLSEREFELIRTMNPHDRCFLIKHGKDSVIARLDLRGLEDFIRVLSGTSKNVTVLDEIRKETGDDPENWLTLFQERMKI